MKELQQYQYYIIRISMGRYNYLQKSFILFVIICSLCFCDDEKQVIVRIKSAALTQYGVKNLWTSKLHQLLSDPKVTHIVIEQTVVAIAGLQKLFSYQLPNLKNLQINEVIVNKPIMQYLLSVEKIYNLETLWLQNNNIFDEDFADLKPRQAKFKNLIITKNQLTGKGLAYLTNLKMPFLKGIDFSYNSLITNQAVDSLIAFGLSNIEIFDFSFTGISENNLLKVFKAMNTNVLQRINFGQNKFSPSFYKQFSKFQFQKLEFLSFSELEIDEEGFQWIKNMHFPSLNNLNLQMNQLTNEMGKELIVKKNMPQLQKITLDSNFINSTFFYNLRQQNFTLRQISCNIDRMDNDGLKQIGNLDLSNFQAIQYKTTTMNQTILIEFLNKINASKMVSMDFSESDNKGDYLPHILNKKWENLKILIVDEIQNFSIEDIREVIFPNLNVISIQYNSIPDQQIMIDMVKNFQHIAPKLMRIDIVSLLAGGIIAQITNGQFKHSITQTLYLNIKQIFPIQSSFKVRLNVDTKPILQQLFIIPVLISTALYNFESGNFQDFDLQDIINFDFDKLKLKFLNKFRENVNMEQLQQLVQQGSFLYINKVVNDNNRKYVFKKLKKLMLGIDQTTDMQILKYCEFPALTTLAIKGGTDEDETNINFKFAQNKFPFLNSFLVQIIMSKQSWKQFFKFNSLSYFLGLILLNVHNLNASDLNEIQSLIPYFHRVRGVGYAQSFINNDLTFLTQSGIVPQRLYLSNILFAPGVLVQLCDINFQYLLTLQLSSVGFDDNSLLELLTCMQKKYNRTVYFPKLSQLKMNKNYIGKAGFTKLFQMGMPQLHSIQFAENMDFQIFNTIFTSPNSKHLRQFMINNAKFYGIDPTINPRHLRRVKSLQISSSSLQQTDIQALSKFDFYSLEVIKLIASRISSCKFLQQLIHLCKNANKVQLAFQDSANLNTTCLINKTQDFSVLAPEVLMVLSDDYGGQMKYFIQKLIGKDSQITILKISNTPMPIDSVIEMLQTSDLTRLTIFQVTNSDLNDKFAKVFFKQYMPQISQLSLSGNDLTSQSFALLKNAKFQNLQILDLSDNLLGDKAIEFLARNQFPRLLQLKLKNIGLTRRGLTMLSQLKAQMLMQLDLSCNDLTYEDLLYFKPNSFYMLNKIILYPEMKYNEVIKLSQVYHASSIVGLTHAQIETNIVDFLEYHLQEDIYNDEQDQVIS